jgi:solute carrier family 13 (sodium-dependent dicarboxylate transporter), member 2/3/5
MGQTFNNLDKSFSHSTFVKILLTLITAFAVYYFIPADEPARRVAFIFVFAALFWAMEIIALYATSLLVVLLSIFSLTQPEGGILELGRSGFEQFLNPFASPVIILFFGGFVLATALNKYEVDRLIASRLMRIFGRRPFWIMIGLMGTTALLSMWMSNTATAAMMIAMVRPLYEQLDRNDPFRTGLVLSIPFSANIGGIGTPVGTPPNAIALGILAQQDPPVYLSFVKWMMMAVPLALLLLAIAAAVLFIIFRPKHKTVNLEISSKNTIDFKTKAVMGIGLFTVLLWLTSELHKLPESVVGLLGAGLFAATGLLNKNDFKKLDWDVLILMWGGLTLGRAIDMSGLSEWIVNLPIFSYEGFILFAVASFMAIFMSTVMSNTATAALLIPIIIVLPGADPIKLAIMVALACSFAMALPVSTPPNAIAFASNIIRSQDMLKAGSVISIICLIIILAGYRIVLPLVFGF